MEQLFLVEKNAEFKSPDHDNQNDWTNATLPKKIENLTYNANILIKNISTEGNCLHFSNCDFSDISFKNDQCVKTFIFENCCIKNLFLFRCEFDLTIINCTIEAITIEETTLNNLYIDSSNINHVYLVSKSKLGTFSLINKSKIETFDDKSATLGSICISASNITLFKISEAIDSFEIKQGASISQLAFADKPTLVSFIKKLRERRKNLKGKTFPQKDSELIHQSYLLLAALDYYEYVHKYQEIDVCLVEQRHVNCLLNGLRRKNPFSKIMYGLKSVVFGKLFGWGVHVYNSFITSLCVVLSFACAYFPLLYSQKGFWRSLWYSFYISINCFFGTDPGFEVCHYIANLENIIGIIILTIFTGVLARKIIK